MKTLVLSMLLMIAMLLRCGCGNSPNGPDKTASIYRLPLSAGNSWRYLNVSETRYSWDDSIHVRADTLWMKVIDAADSGWMNVRFVFAGGSARDTFQTQFVNRRDGVFARNYHNLAGALPLFKVRAGADETLLLPTRNSPATWWQGMKECRAGGDSTIVIDGSSYDCGTVEARKDSVLHSVLFYNDCGILKKTYLPDTAVNAKDTIVSKNTIILDTHKLK